MTGPQIKEYRVRFVDKTRPDEVVFAQQVSWRDRTVHFVHTDGTELCGYALLQVLSVTRIRTDQEGAGNGSH